MFSKHVQSAEIVTITEGGEKQTIAKVEANEVRGGHRQLLQNLPSSIDDIKALQHTQRAVRRNSVH